MAPSSFAFVSADKFGRLKDADLTVVRRHVMLGKNMTIGITANNEARQTISSLRPPKRRLHDTPDRPGGRAKPVRDRPEAEPTLTMPPPPPSDLHLVNFAGNVDGYALMLISNWFKHREDKIYPVELGVDFDPNKTICFQWLSMDVAYLHSVLFMASAIQDLFMHKPLGKATRCHLGMTISALNDKLSDRAASLQDSTISVVISFITLFSVLQDHATAKVHAAGLKQIVQLRGGLDSFRNNRRLYVKLCRADLAYFLQTGEGPIFFTDPKYWPPLSEDLELDGGIDWCSSPNGSQLTCDIKDERVTVIFRELQQFSEMLNMRRGCARRLRVPEFENILCSIQYRLIQLHGTLNDFLTECVRLSMLIFLTTTCQMPETAVRYPYLRNRFRECYGAVEKSNPSRQSLMLWLLMVGAVSLYGVDEPWLREQWQADVSPDMTWYDARQQLKDIMWIDAIHDKLGEYAFNALNNRGAIKLDQNSPGIWASGWGVCPFHI